MFFTYHTCLLTSLATSLCRLSALLHLFQSVVSVANLAKRKARQMVSNLLFFSNDPEVHGIETSLI